MLYKSTQVIGSGLLTTDYSQFVSHEITRNTIIRIERMSSTMAGEARQICIIMDATVISQYHEKIGG